MLVSLSPIASPNHCSILALVPPWVRIYRVQRDIPMPLVSSGVEKGNLRELALARMAALGLRCRDVRTREVGIQDVHYKVRTRSASMRVCPTVMLRERTVILCWQCWVGAISCGVL